MYKFVQASKYSIKLMLTCAVMTESWDVIHKKSYQYATEYCAAREKIIFRYI